MVSFLLWLIGSFATFVYLVEEEEFQNTPLTITMLSVVSLAWPIYWVLSVPVYWEYFKVPFTSVINLFSKEQVESTEGQDTMGFSLGEK